MNLREQEYMYIVAKFASISKAAEFLHISQPSLSQFVQRVEREFGYEIFDRSHKTLALTREGEEYIRTCENIIQAECFLKQYENILNNNQKKILKEFIDLKNKRNIYFIESVIKNSFYKSGFIRNAGLFFAFL